MTKTAIEPTRKHDFAGWYQQVIHSADLAEVAPVKGCMVLKPYGYAIWENIQKIFDARLKKIGVQNAYFPMLIPFDFLAKEAEHIEGFAKECAVVTHSRITKDEFGNLVPDGKLPFPYIIRPTSETIIGNVVSKWIRTYRDLPLKLNQWCNVIRWEMRTRLFIRTTEFLWQEGHTIFETQQEAHQDALKILDMYSQLITEDLAMPGIKGEKTPEEKFPGASNTYTIEVIMQDGKVLQAATSHYLGQTFSKAFDIKYLGKDNQEHLAYTSSWGISTRIIGGIIMSHGDDDGLILPPSVAPYQVVIIPVENRDNNSEISKYCLRVQEKLDSLGVSTYLDQTGGSSSSKNWKWIKKGAPLRMILGAKELAQNNFSLARRDQEHSKKMILSFTSLDEIPALLCDITENIKRKAREYSQARIVEVDSLLELEDLFSRGFKGLASLKLSETDKEAFKEIATKYSITRSCLPIDQNQQRVLVGRSY